MSETSEPLVRAHRRKRAWLIPGLLLVLFVSTALATIWVKEDGFRARLAEDDDPASRPVQGGVFRYPLLEPFHTLDPARAVYKMEVMLVQQIYDGLTGFDRHLRVVPALAKFWEISPDGRTYTFELRENARFHNGRRVTAEDCVFSFERLLTKGAERAQLSLLQPHRGRFGVPRRQSRAREGSRGRRRGHVPHPLRHTVRARALGPEHVLLQDPPEAGSARPGGRVLRVSHRDRRVPVRPLHRARGRPGCPGQRWSASRRAARGEPPVFRRPAAPRCHHLPRSLVREGALRSRAAAQRDRRLRRDE